MLLPEKSCRRGDIALHAVIVKWGLTGSSFENEGRAINFARPLTAAGERWPRWNFSNGSCSSLLGVAGDELFISTLVLLFGVDIKLAGSLSLAVSLPTMIVGFSRYSRDSSFSVLGRNRTFLLVMAAGSMIGTFVGGLLLGLVTSAVLLPALAVILLISAVKVWRHR